MFSKGTFASYILIILLPLSLALAAPALTPQQRDALMQAIHLGQYPVNILETEIDGIHRSVILLGETHKVSQQRHFLALDLINRFNLIGVEGIEIPGSIEYLYDGGHTMLMPANEAEKVVLESELLSQLVGPYPGPIRLAFDRYIVLQEKILDFLNQAKFS